MTARRPNRYVVVVIPWDDTGATRIFGTFQSRERGELVRERLASDFPEDEYAVGVVRIETAP